jgi:hypothetical protein
MPKKTWEQVVVDTPKSQLLQQNARSLPPQPIQWLQPSPTPVSQSSTPPISTKFIGKIRSMLSNCENYPQYIFDKCSLNCTFGDYNPITIGGQTLKCTVNDILWPVYMSKTKYKNDVTVVKPIEEDDCPQYRGVLQWPVAKVIAHDAKISYHNIMMDEIEKTMKLPDFSARFKDFEVGRIFHLRPDYNVANNTWNISVYQDNEGVITSTSSPPITDKLIDKLFSNKKFVINLKRWLSDIFWKSNIGPILQKLGLGNYFISVDYYKSRSSTNISYHRDTVRNFPTIFVGLSYKTDKNQHGAEILLNANPQKIYGDQNPVLSKLIPKLKEKMDQLNQENEKNYAFRTVIPKNGSLIFSDHLMCHSTPYAGSRTGLIPGAADALSKCSTVEISNVKIREEKLPLLTRQFSDENILLPPPPKPPRTFFRYWFRSGTVYKEFNPRSSEFEYKYQQIPGIHLPQHTFSIDAFPMNYNKGTFLYLSSSPEIYIISDIPSILPSLNPVIPSIWNPIKLPDVYQFSIVAVPPKWLVESVKNNWPDALAYSEYDGCHKVWGGIDDINSYTLVNDKGTLDFSNTSNYSGVNVGYETDPRWKAANPHWKAKHHSFMWARTVNDPTQHVEDWEIYSLMSQDIVFGAGYTWVNVVADGYTPGGDGDAREPWINNGHVYQVLVPNNKETKEKLKRIGSKNYPRSMYQTLRDSKGTIYIIDPDTLLPKQYNPTFEIKITPLIEERDHHIKFISPPVTPGNPIPKVNGLNSNNIIKIPKINDKCKIIRTAKTNFSEALLQELNGLNVKIASRKTDNSFICYFTEKYTLRNMVINETNLIPDYKIKEGEQCILDKPGHAMHGKEVTIGQRITINNIRIVGYTDIFNELNFIKCTTITEILHKEWYMHDKKYKDKYGNLFNIYDFVFETCTTDKINVLCKPIKTGALSIQKPATTGALSIQKPTTNTDNISQILNKTLKRKPVVIIDDENDPVGATWIKEYYDSSIDDKINILVNVIKNKKEKGNKYTKNFIYSKITQNKQTKVCEFMNPKQFLLCILWNIIVEETYYGITTILDTKATTSLSPPETETETKSEQQTGIPGLSSKIVCKEPIANDYKIKGDGNCLFNCFSYWLYGTQNESTRVRRQICEYGSYPLTDPMWNDGEWGTQKEIGLASQLYQAEITICDDKGRGLGFVEPNRVAVIRRWKLRLVGYKGPSQNGLHFQVISPNPPVNILPIPSSIIPPSIIPPSIIPPSIIPPSIITAINNIPDDLDLSKTELVESTDNINKEIKGQARITEILKQIIKREYIKNKNELFDFLKKKFEEFDRPKERINKAPILYLGMILDNIIFDQTHL